VIKLAVKVPGARRVKANLRSVARKHAVKVRKYLEWGADMAAERAKVNLNKAAQSGRGTLSQSIWAGRASGRYQSGISVETGWDYKYGSVLEWGPEQARAGWEIRPRNFPYLIFPIKDKSGNVEKVIRTKRVWHPWDDSQRRPHFEKAVDAVWPMVTAKLAGALKEVL
jgi:hypothetical protein